MKDKMTVCGVVWMLRLRGCVCDHLHDALNNWTQSRLKEKLLQYLCVCDSGENLVDIINTYGERCSLRGTGPRLRQFIHSGRFGGKSSTALLGCGRECTRTRARNSSLNKHQYRGAVLSHHQCVLPVLFCIREMLLHQSRLSQVERTSSVAAS